MAYNKASNGSVSDTDTFSPIITLETNLRTTKGAGPSGFEPETTGFLSCVKVKSPVLYLAELRAHSALTLTLGII